MLPHHAIASGYFDEGTTNDPHSPFLSASPDDVLLPPASLFSPAYPLQPVAQHSETVTKTVITPTSSVTQVTTSSSGTSATPPVPAPAIPALISPTTSIILPSAPGSPSQPLKKNDASLFADNPTEFLKAIAGSSYISLELDGIPLHSDITAPVHINEAVAFALKNNFEVLAADQKVRGAFWDKMGGYAEYVPSVQAGIDSGNETSQPASINDAQGNRVLDNTHNRQDHSVTITQPLVNLSLIADILSGEDKEDVAQDDRLDSREGVALDTISAYLDLLQARLSVQLADDYKKYLDDLAVRMRKRVEGGGATEADFQRIKSRAANADSARVEAMGSYQTYMSQIKRLTRIVPTIITIPGILVPEVPPTPQEAIDHALTSNPAYLSSVKKIDVAKDDKQKSLSGLLPNLSLEYTNSYSFNAGGAAEGNPVDGVYPTQKTQQLMLVAQFALNGGTAATGGMSGAAKMEEMSYRADDARSRIEDGITSSYMAINAARQRQAILAQNVDASSKVVAGFELQFASGTRSLFDLLDAYEQLYNARLNLMRVTIANAKAAYQVRRIMGDLAPSIINAEKGI